LASFGKQFDYKIFRHLATLVLLIVVRRWTLTCR